jgi:hypothetical protein
MPFRVEGGFHWLQKAFHLTRNNNISLAVYSRHGKHGLDRPVLAFAGYNSAPTGTENSISLELATLLV